MNISMILNKVQMSARHRFVLNIDKFGLMLLQNV